MSDVDWAEEGGDDVNSEMQPPRSEHADENLGVSLVAAVATRDLADLATSLGEVAIDAVMKDGALRDVPVVGSLIGLMRVGAGVREALYLKKVALFLRELAGTPYENRTMFVDELCKTPDMAREFGETVLLLLERADAMEKPAIIGRLFRAAAMAQISYGDARRIAFMVDRLYVTDLAYLAEFKDGTSENPEIEASLNGVGLLITEGMDGGTFGRSSIGFTFKRNRYAKLLVEFGLARSGVA